MCRISVNKQGFIQGFFVLLVRALFMKIRILQNRDESFSRELKAFF